MHNISRDKNKLSLPTVRLVIEYTDPSNNFVGYCQPFTKVGIDIILSYTYKSTTPY